MRSIHIHTLCHETLDSKGPLRSSAPSLSSAQGWNLKHAPPMAASSPTSPTWQRKPLSQADHASWTWKIMWETDAKVTHNPREARALRKTLQGAADQRHPEPPPPLLSWLLAFGRGIPGQRTQFRAAPFSRLSKFEATP